MKRVILSLASFLVLTTVISVPAFAKGEWVSVRTRNFLLVGNASEKQIQQVGLRLEEFRAAFSQLFGKGDLDSHAPVTVIIFDSQESYRPFKPKESTAGFFQSNPHSNYITLSTEVQGEQDPYSVVFHEYTHLLISAINGNMPTWFDEGLAEYYSTASLSGNEKVVLGKPISRHLAELRHGPLLSLKTLFEVNRYSPYYNETDKQTIFYAESWALMHYLISGNNGKWATQLGKLVELLASNMPAEQAFQQSFEASLENMESELLAYVQRDHFATVSHSFDKHAEKVANLKATRLSEAEAQAYLGDLLLQGNRSEGEAYIQRALALDPNLAMAHASLGLLRSREGKTEEARLCLERAVAAAPANYLVHYYYAYVLSRTGATSKDMVLGFAPETIALMRGELKKALDLKPDFLEAHNLVAFANLVAGEQLDEAAKTLQRSLARSPGRNDLVLLLAQVYIRQENYKAARQLLNAVNRNSGDSQLSERVQDLLRQISGIEEALARVQAGKDPFDIETKTDPNPSAGGTVEPFDPSTTLRAALRKPADGETQVQGTLVRVDCDEKGFTLVLKVSDRIMSLKTNGFRNLNFRSFNSDAGREITCGPRMAGNNVVVTYVRPTTGRTPMAGTTRSIEFVPDDFKLNPD